MRGHIRASSDFNAPGNTRFSRFRLRPGFAFDGEIGALALLCVWLFLVSYFQVVAAGRHSDFPDWLMYKLAPRN